MKFETTKNNNVVFCILFSAVVDRIRRRRPSEIIIASDRRALFYRLRVSDPNAKPDATVENETVSTGPSVVGRTMCSRIERDVYSPRNKSVAGETTLPIIGQKLVKWRHKPRFFNMRQYISVNRQRYEQLQCRLLTFCCAKNGWKCGYGHEYAQPQGPTPIKTDRDFHWLRARKISIETFSNMLHV